MARKIRSTIAEAESLLREVEAAMKAETDPRLLDKLRSQKNRALKLRSTAQTEQAKHEARLVDSPQWRELSAKLRAASDDMCPECVDKLLAAIA